MPGAQAVEQSRYFSLVMGIIGIGGDIRRQDKCTRCPGKEHNPKEKTQVGKDDDNDGSYHLVRRHGVVCLAYRILR